MTLVPTIYPDQEIIEKTQAKLERPPMYKVLLLNDDFTPMDFVVRALQQVFQKDEDEATRIMLAVHEAGVGLCGIYPYEVAETKAMQMVQLARAAEHPLQTAVEKE